ncbi:hypothetical protein D9N00_26465 [Pseudomonas syringae pv. actinidiae]|nr:hypothetical protein D9N00_26465 [Pseudomonas syringae pv. actinidiae]AYL82967.1 hypothetical protein CN228_26485 [Pseudomonas syringae pv. actinidiae str. Shaanxi_M228]
MRGAAQSFDAERHATHSDAGACATITSTIVRRSASHAVLDAPRPVLSLRCVTKDISTGMRCPEFRLLAQACRP